MPFQPTGIPSKAVRAGIIRIDTKRVYLGNEELPADDRLGIAVDKEARSVRFVPAGPREGWKVLAFGAGASKILMPQSFLDDKLVPYGIYKKTGLFTYTHQNYIKGRRK